MKAILVWLVSLMAFSAAVAQTKPFSEIIEEWRAFTPLKTTRADVERLIGNSGKSTTGGAYYSIGSVKLYARYSKGACENNLEGWNVPPNTLIDFSVYPSDPIQLAGDSFSSSFVVRHSTNSIVLQNEGISITFVDSVEESLGMGAGRVSQVRFLPTERDNSLRCAGYPKYNPAGALYRPAITFAEDIPAGLDFVVTESAGMATDFVTYIISYQASSLSNKASRRLFREHEEHLYRKRTAAKDKIQLVDGGRRKISSIEVFYLRKSDPMPVPSPEFLDGR